MTGCRAASIAALSASRMQSTSIIHDLSIMVFLTSDERQRASGSRCYCASSTTITVWSDRGPIAPTPSAHFPRPSGRCGCAAMSVAGMEGCDSPVSVMSTTARAIAKGRAPLRQYPNRFNEHSSLVTGRPHRIAEQFPTY
jgi:hypothetical protein